MQLDWLPAPSRKLASQLILSSWAKEIDMDAPGKPIIDQLHSTRSTILLLPGEKAGMGAVVIVDSIVPLEYPTDGGWRLVLPASSD